MFLLKKKYIIKLGFNLGLNNLTQYNFLTSIVMSNKLFSSLIDLELVFYKLLLLRNFLKLYNWLLYKKSKLLIVDGTEITNYSRRYLYETYIKNLNHFYINEDLWYPNAHKDLRWKEIYFIIYWDYASLILDLNPWSVDLPFLFFFQRLPEFFKFININKFKESHFIFSTSQSDTINFFWLSTFINLINIKDEANYKK